LDLSGAFIFAALAGLQLAVPAAAACSASRSQPVGPGNLVERPIRGSECHRYTANSDLPLWVSVEESDVDLAALVGERRLESGARRSWLEAFLLEPGPDGVAAFAIEAAGTRGLIGSYRLTVAQLHPTHPRAAALRRALELTMQGEHAAAAEAWLGADRPLEAAWMRLAEAWKEADAGRLGTAVSLLERADEVLSGTGHDAARTRLVIPLGLVLIQMRRYGDAAAVLEAGIRRASRLDDPSLLAELHLYYGLVRHNRDSLSAARAEYETAAALLARDPDPFIAGMLHNNFAGIHYLLGEPEAAFARFEQAETIARDIGDDQNYAEALRNEAQLAANLGMFDRALVKFTAALEVFEARDQRGDVANVLWGIGSTYLGLGVFERAREFLELALERAEQADDPAAAFSARLLLGEAYRHLDQPALALAVHEHALADSERHGKASNAARAAAAWGKDSLAAGRADEAVPRLQRAVATFRKISYRRELADALYALGTAHLAGDASRDARAAFAEAERLQRELGDARGLVLTLTRKARLESEDGDLAGALATAAEAAEVLERARGNVSNSDLQASFFGSRLQPYDELVRLHLASGERNGQAEPAALAALAAAERSRSRTLKDLLARGRASEGGTAHAELTGRLNGQLMRLRKLQETLERAGEDDALRARAAAEIESTKSSLRRLRLELDALDARTAASDPLRAALLAAPDDLDGIAADLPGDVAVLAYYVGAEEATGWLVRRGSIRAFRLPPSADVEQAALSAFEVASHWDPEVDPVYDALQAVADMVLPALDEEAGLRRLVVVPDGALHRVPFAALPMPRNPGTLLLERYEISTAPAVGLVRAGVSGWPPGSATIAVFAAPVFEARTLAAEILPPEAGGTGLAALLASLGPLPYSREEARQIRTIAEGWTVDLYEGQDATKQALSQPAFGSHAIVHFATHAVVSSEFPELSGLVLSQVDAAGRPVDGLLHLQEIYDLPLGADLVVLSACRTGRGRSLRGAGPVSLGRAFLLAGAKRVVTTHWSIPDDVTADLMGGFYAAMLERGMTPPAALREAQLSIAGDAAFEHPFFWAGFSLTGVMVD
jgi:tetratricopeptide (TPR) repeat protein